MSYWDGFCYFFVDGCVELDFNIVECSIWLLMFNCKNVFFVGFDDGGDNWVVIVLFIEIVKLNCVDL